MIKSKKDIDKWLTTILTGLFMFMVLYIYKGYNIYQAPSLSGHSLLTRAILHGVATSLVFYVCEFHIRKYFRLNTPLKFTFWIAAEILIGIQVTFLLFNYFWNWTEFYWISYSMFLYEYPLVVTIPIILSRLVALSIKNHPTSSEEFIEITSENRKNKFKVKAAKLLYIQSAENYVDIYYLSNNKINKHLLRKSLKEIDEEYADKSYLVRCHRSYMVNPMNIEHVQRDSRSVKLDIAGNSIPVSKKYISNFPEELISSSIPHLENSSQKI